MQAEEAEAVDDPTWSNSDVRDREEEEEEEEDDTEPQTKKIRVRSKKIKLSKKNTAPLVSKFNVEEPRIMNTVAVSEPAQSENLYGLDISILKSLNMDHLLDEKKAQQDQNTSKENWYL